MKYIIWRDTVPNYYVTKLLNFDESFLTIRYSFSRRFSDTHYFISLLKVIRILFWINPNNMELLPRTRFTHEFCIGQFKIIEK